MSFYNKDNSLTDILDEEKKAKKDLEKINKSTNGNICDFKSIFLQNKINKIHSKIKHIMLGTPDNDNNIA